MNNSTYITIVLDRSGSMEEIAKQTIAGFNSFLKEQQSVKGDAKITLVQFDHEYQPVYEAIDIHIAPELTRKTYVPRGMTALLDAIGTTIKSTREKIKLMKEHERPSKLIFVVITDGHENHSRYFSRKDIFNKISKMEEKHKWQFVFLGANQDAIDEAGRLGVKAHKAMTYAADSMGTEAMFFDLSRNIAECREKDVDFNFSIEQRKKQQRDN
jgi:Mg-chelatase subunit ChlD